MFGLLELVWLFTRGLPRCTLCKSVIWIAPGPGRGEVGVGREYYDCICGAKYPTGNREWIHLTTDERVNISGQAP